MIYKLGCKTPQIHANSFIAKNATIIGDVTLESDVSIWFGATIRGDNDSIIIRHGSNIQENSVLHTDFEIKLIVESNVTVGHSATLHGCKIGKNSLIGINSIILNNAIIGNNCLIAANSLVTENQLIPDNSLVMGSPGKVIRELSQKEINTLKNNAEHYIAKISDYRSNLKTV